MASESNNWVPVTDAEKAQAKPECRYLDFREGWNTQKADTVLWKATRHGVRQQMLCSDRTRKYCMKLGGLCHKARTFPPSAKDEAYAKHQFGECRRYCLQQETVLVDRPKELKLRNGG
jgi:hypothetical protein